MKQFLAQQTFLLFLFSCLGINGQSVYDATSVKSSTDPKDWVLKSGVNGYSSPSQIIVDGSSNLNVGGSVKIISGSGSSGTGNIELQTGNKILFLYQSSQNTSARVGIGFTDPQEALHINGNIRGNIGAGAIRINTTYGYMDLGASTSSYASFSTDRDYFYFNKPLSSAGNLHLQTDGTTRFVILSNSGYVGLNNTAPQEVLHINGNIRGNLNGGALRINTLNGYLDLGPQTTECANINTDRTYFLFNKPLSSAGDMQLQTDGFTRVRITSDGKLGLRTNLPVIGKFQFGNDYPIYLDDNICCAGTEWKTCMVGFNLVKKADGMWETKWDGNFNGGGAITSDAGGQFHFYSFASRNTGNQNYSDADFLQKKVFSIGNQGDVYVPNCLRIGSIVNAYPYKLSVEGNIIAEEVVVKLFEDWPDYVFSECYMMKTLTELENFIKANKHLPDVPTANEIKTQGIALGHFNIILLKKIEELTIILIDQNKRIAELEKLVIK